MSYMATVVKVMIASPNDVEHERRIVREEVHNWNEIYAPERRLVALPVGWDSHSYPLMGGRPQAIINKQVLSDCDLLVGIFWTRLGSPTGEAPSGTVEEINEHIRAGKPAMLYFSNAPVRPDSVDEQQYRGLVAFRRDCERNGLVHSYESRAEFKENFRRHLIRALLNMAGAGEEPDPVTQLPAPDRAPPISPEASTLLQEAARSADGTILRLRTFGGLAIQANRRQFVQDTSPRTEALWEAAVKELAQTELITDRGHKGEVFTVTRAGYRMADSLSET